MPRPSNLALIYEDVARFGTLAGGSWVASLPVANLQTPYLAEIARSTDVATTSTFFTADLGSLKPIGGLAIGGCQVTPYATVRVRAWFGSTSDAPVYDSGAFPFPGTIVDSSQLDWEDPNFWDGVSQDFDDRHKGSLLIHFPPNQVYARNWRVDFADTNHPAGRLDLGRLIMGRVWQPDINYTYDNNSFDFEALTDMEESRNGTRQYNPRNLRRILNVGFENLPEDDTFRDVYRIAVRAGIHNQVVVVPDPTIISNWQREAILGTLGTPPSLRRSAFRRASTALQIQEVL